MKDQIVNNSASVENFSKFYPYLNKYLFENADFVQSRNGDTKEVLNFKTELHNPYKRCVGNNERNINIFFLLAESLWIWSGRKDLEFLEIFNTQMKEYSDDGKNFHAPYGFRLRHYGVSSFDTYVSKNELDQHYANQVNSGMDQIQIALNMLSKDSENRRTVLSIWNPELDLDKKSKDLPCNDLFMLKVRSGCLHSTIANRSNDLHWGLPTNIFQFGFISESMSNILGLKLGTQVHNSQSLHFYLDNKIAENMYSNIQISPSFTDLYDISEPMKIDMDFIDVDTVDGRLRKTDLFINMVINSIQSGERLGVVELGRLKTFSDFLTFTYHLLWIYREYKLNMKKDDKSRMEMYEGIKGMFGDEFGHLDVYVLALNFFASKLDNLNEEVIGKL